MKVLSSVLMVGALALSACASAPQPCDMQKSLGACSVRVDLMDGKVMVCADEQPSQPANVCKNATIDVTTNKGYAPRKLLLLPGQCRSLGTAVSSAAQSSCEAFALNADAAGAAAGK